MLDQEIIEKVKEEIAKKLRIYITIPGEAYHAEYWEKTRLLITNQILSIVIDDRYAVRVVDLKAKLPEVDRDIYWYKCKQTQERMLKTGWVKEVKDG